MASLSLKGTLKVENKSIGGALVPISQALRGLASCLQEFREVETLLGLESAGEADCGGANDTGRHFLRGVAGTLKEMVGKLVLDIQAKPEIQKLLMVIKESICGAANEGATSANQGSSCIIETVALEEAEAACTSAMHSRTVKSSSGESSGMQAFLCSSSRGDGPIPMEHITSGVGTVWACEITHCQINHGYLCELGLVRIVKINKFQTSSL